MLLGLPWWLSDKEPAYKSRRYGFNSWIGKTPWRRKWQLPPPPPGRGACGAIIHGVAKSWT